MYVYILYIHTYILQFFFYIYLRRKGPDRERRENEMGLEMTKLHYIDT